MSSSEQEELNRPKDESQIREEERQIREEADRDYGSGFEGYEYYEAGGTDEVEAVIKRLKTRDQQTGDPILDDKAFDKLRSFRDEKRIPIFTDQISPLKRKSMWLFSRKRFSRKLKSFAVDRKNWEQTEDGREWTEEIHRLEAILGKKDQEKMYRDTLSTMIVRRGQICQAARAASDRKLDELTAANPELKSRFEYQGSADPDKMDRLFEFVNPERNDEKISAAREEFLQAELVMAAQDMRVLAKKEAGDISDYTWQANSYSGNVTSGLYNHDLRSGKKITPAIVLRNGLSGLRINRDLVTRKGVQGVELLAHMIGIDPKEDPDTGQPLIEDPDTGLPLTEERLMELFQSKMAQYPEGLIISDKGFFSTALKDSRGFPAVAHSVMRGASPPIASTHGIEFIILVRKGTCAADIKTVTRISEEWEILVNAGTRFRVVKAFFNTDAPGDQREIFLGNPKSWKIYLETIPPEDNGTERNED